VLASVETYGHLGKPIMRYIRTVSDLASSHSLAVIGGFFLAIAHREMIEALVQSQGYVYHACALLLNKAAERQVLPEADTPLHD
jgi:hypothetical protein